MRAVRPLLRAGKPKGAFTINYGILCFFRYGKHLCDEDCIDDARICDGLVDYAIENSSWGLDESVDLCGDTRWDRSENG